MRPASRRAASAARARRFRVSGGTLVAALVCLSAPASVSILADDDLAKRTLANAEQLLREGKVEQALKDFEQVTKAWPDSAVADDSLYRMGSYYYPVDTFEGLGGASQGALTKAKDLLARIPAKYPREDHAPRALLKLGLIAMDPVNPGRNLDEAYASFIGIVNIYPSSDAVDRALLGAGYADLLAGRADQAIATFERIVEEFAGSPVCEDARFWMAEAFARQGSYVRSMEELQAVRSRFPEGRLSGRALDRLSMIYKTKFEPGLRRQLFALDGDYAPQLDPNGIRGAVAIAVDDESRVHVLYHKTGMIARLAHGGKLTSTGQPLAGGVAISLDPKGVEVLAARTAFRAGTHLVHAQRQERGGLKPITGLARAVRMPDASIALLDTERSEILLFKGDALNIGVLYRDPAERVRLAGLALGAAGKLYTIDQRQGRILEIGPGGAAREIALQEEGTRRELADMAADDLGTLYLLDARNDSLLVVTTEGKILQEIASTPGAAGEFAYASAIAAGPRGEIYLYDDKRKTLLRFW